MKASTIAPDGTADRPIAAIDRRRLSPEKQALLACRRLNVAMLTTQRGSKNTLARLAGTTGSRISLMTAGHKPVSAPFALAIEDSLKLPRGWLDQPHGVEEVPRAVWQLLGGSYPPPALKQADEKPARKYRQAQQSYTPTPAALFDKPAGQVGPIAEALAKKILQLSATEQLSENRAFQLLGLLIDGVTEN
jgi:hypothetical protein